jgi:hypothetical protein
MHRPDLPPEDIISYVHDMLSALALMAIREGEPELGHAIQQASDLHRPTKEVNH